MCQQMSYKFINRFRLKLLRVSSPIFIVCLLFCFLSFLFYRSLLNSTNSIDSSSFWTNDDVEQWIDNVRDIAILNENFLFNISYRITITDVPEWISQYNLMHFFNFLWLQNDAYRWHLQQLMNFRDRLINRTFPPARRISHEDLRSSENVFQLIEHQPLNGILLDTAADPISSIFPPLPRTSSSLKQFCEENFLTQRFSPCSIRSEKLSFTSHFQTLITYALYNVVLSGQTLSTHHYNELVYLNNENKSLNSMDIVQGILPSLIRLLALVPKTAVFLLPNSFENDSIIDQYLNIFIERDLISTKQRFIRLNSSISYHSYALYSTSTDRSDIVLLQNVLLTSKSAPRRELILVLEKHFDSTSYNGIIQTINQFELPAEYEYLHLHEYKEMKLNVKQIADLFRRSRIIIGMPSDLLSNLVWCFPGTHLIEVANNNLKIDSYRMSVQLQVNYWLVRVTRQNRVDIDDFRTLLLKVLTNIDN